MNKNDPEAIISIAGGQIQLRTSVEAGRSSVGEEKFT